MMRSVVVPENELEENSAGRRAGRFVGKRGDPGLPGTVGVGLNSTKFEC